MERWIRFKYMPNLPLKKGANVALFGKACAKSVL